MRMPANPHRGRQLPRLALLLALEQGQREVDAPQRLLGLLPAAAGAAAAAEQAGVSRLPPLRRWRRPPSAAAASLLLLLLLPLSCHRSESHSHGGCSDSRQEEGAEGAGHLQLLSAALPLGRWTSEVAATYDSRCHRGLRRESSKSNGLSGHLQVRWRTHSVLAHIWMMHRHCRLHISLACCAELPARTPGSCSRQSH